jgi:hypothetical protein
MIPNLQCDPLHAVRHPTCSTIPYLRYDHGPQVDGVIVQRPLLPPTQVLLLDDQVATDTAKVAGTIVANLPGVGPASPSGGDIVPRRSWGLYAVARGVRMRMGTDQGSADWA